MSTDKTYYQTQDFFVHRKIADTDVLISVSDNVANFNGYITLNTTASFLWDSLKEPCTVSELTNKLTEEFDVSEETAKKDVENFIEMLLKNSMVKPYEET